MAPQLCRWLRANSYGRVNFPLTRCKRGFGTCIDRLLRGGDDLDRLLTDRADGLGDEALADAEVGVDVAPVGGVTLELLPQLPDEHVHRAIAVGHRVAPDLLVDLLALDHLAVCLGEELQKLELASGEADALAAD